MSSTNKTWNAAENLIYYVNKFQNYLDSVNDGYAYIFTLTLYRLFALNQFFKNWGNRTILSNQPSG